MGFTEVLASYSPSSLWPLDETSGTTANDYMGVVNGTYVNSPTLNQVGMFGSTSKAVLFINSSGSGIDFGDVYNFTGTSQFTTYCVIKPRDYNTGTGGNLFSNVGLTANGWALDLANPAVSFRMQRCDAVSCDTILHQIPEIEFESFNRLFVAMRFDGSNLILNLNGADVKTQASTKVMTNDTTGLRFGAYNAGGSGYDGLASHVAIFSSALSEATLKEIYNKAVEKPYIRFPHKFF